MATRKETETAEEENRRLQAEVTALKEDMARLREDILNLTRALGDSAADYREDAREEMLRKARAAQAKAAEQLEKAQAAGQKMVEDMEVRIVERPFMSLLTAASVGFILAKLLDLGNRR